LLRQPQQFHGGNGAVSLPDYPLDRSKQHGEAPVCQEEVFALLVPVKATATSLEMWAGAHFSLSRKCLRVRSSRLRAYASPRDRLHWVKNSFRAWLCRGSSLCNCRHFAVHQRVRRGWRSLFEFCLLLSMAFPRRKLGTGPQTQECHKTHAG
jgi:hypothetical protein